MGKPTEGVFIVAVGAIIEHPQTGKILLIKRSFDADFRPNEWEFPIGRMKQFEDPDAALQREVQEEVGISVQVKKPVSTFHIFRGEKRAENDLIGIVYWCTTIDTNITLSSEHNEYCWETPEKALKKITVIGLRDDVQAFIREKELYIH